MKHSHNYLSLFMTFCVVVFISNVAYAQRPTRSAINLGLSVKWANMNIGADTPEEYGNYYAWGEIEPKIEYSDLNSKTFSKDLLDISNTYSNDAAKSNWEIGWRMPSKEETEELIEKCTWYWIMQKGIRGYRVVGPNGNSIFLPATGYRSFRDNYNDGIMGYIWTSSYDKNNNIKLVFLTMII